GFGPLGKMIEPLGEISFDRAIQFFREMIKAAVRAKPDLILIETMTDIKEAKAAVIAAREVTDLPVEVHIAYSHGSKTVTGTSPEAAVVILNSLGVNIIGSNCGFGLEEHEAILRKEMPIAGCFLAVLPNAGIPKLIDDKTVFAEPPEAFHVYAERYRDLGANLIGGCCGTTPDHIREVARAVKGKPPRKRDATKAFALASRSKASFLNSSSPFFVIGERINPTARKALSEEFKGEKMAVLRREAMEQVQAGARALDINVGVPGVDQVSLMKKAVQAVENVVDVPLVLDSDQPEVLEAGLKQVSGKALINSVSGKESSLEKVLPLAKKYGAAVLGLTLDEKGIPKTADERVAIAKRILDHALKIGIAKEDIIIDPLTLTVSVEPASVYESLEAVRRVRKDLGLEVSLGVSNISYGLPNRSIINARFLELAVRFGLSAAIINPKDSAVMTVALSRPKSSPDKKSVRAFIDSVDKLVKEKIEPPAKTSSAAKPPIGTRLYEAILYGEKESIEPLVEEALREHPPLEINKQFLVPALEEVGRRFERGEFFLPQILLAAETMQRAFKRLKKAIEKEGHRGEAGRIVFATVEGDVHDIGKNIVITVLENYGYIIYDLGISVSADKILDEAIAKKAQLIALSALMTTTMEEMEKVTRIVKERNLPFKTIVGGAVVNKEYADSIGASGYAKDAIEAVRVVRSLLGK
ncbi:MAG: dihydropteroate synthase, partial [Candidatus Omnitrophica bacterium]|nr:dihydropteroate synthase [Candidatus Omnitrophota bacterium]